MGGGNLLGNFIPVADFPLKCCIEEQKSKNKISESNHRTGDSNIPPKDIPAGHEFIDR